MPLIFCCSLPHPPMLIPNLGKDYQSALPQTVKSFLIVANYLQKNNIETLIIISPHGNQDQGFFNINIAHQFKVNFSIFGDLSTKQEVEGDLILGSKIKNHFELDRKINLIVESEIDYGSGIIIYLLSQDNNYKFKVLPIYPDYSDLFIAYEFGQKIQSIVNSQSARIAVVSSANLSHKINKKSPAGYSRQAKKFDIKILEIIKNNQWEDLLKIDNGLREKVAECGLAPLAVLAGILKDINYKVEFLGYENYFGVGYPNFIFSFYG